MAKICGKRMLSQIIGMKKLVFTPLSILLLLLLALAVFVAIVANFINSGGGNSLGGGIAIMFAIVFGGLLLIEQKLVELYKRHLKKIRLMELVLICLTLVIFAVLLSSCLYNDRPDEVYLSDRDFVENSRLFSPDSSMVALDYSIDLGAFGSGRRGTAIFKSSDIHLDLSQFTLSQEYLDVKWVNDKTVSARIDIIPNLRAGKKTEIRDTQINGVYVKVFPYDSTEPNDTLNIINSRISPNGKYELVCYRYSGLDRLGFLNVSVIKKGDKLPRYGNYFISDGSADYILKARWNRKSELLLYSNSSYAQMVEGFLVTNRPDINYYIITADIGLEGKYRMEN